MMSDSYERSGEFGTMAGQGPGTPPQIHRISLSGSLNHHGIQLKKLVFMLQIQKQEIRDSGHNFEPQTDKLTLKTMYLQT